jgi:hypothetical protein
MCTIVYLNHFPFNSSSSSTSTSTSSSSSSRTGRSRLGRFERLSSRRRSIAIATTNGRGGQKATNALTNQGQANVTVWQWIAPDRCQIVGSRLPHVLFGSLQCHHDRIPISKRLCKVRGHCWWCRCCCCCGSRRRLRRCCCCTSAIVWQFSHSNGHYAMLLDAKGMGNARLLWWWWWWWSRSCRSFSRIPSTCGVQYCWFCSYSDWCTDAASSSSSSSARGDARRVLFGRRSHSRVNDCGRSMSRAFAVRLTNLWLLLLLFVIVVVADAVVAAVARHWR